MGGPDDRELIAALLRAPAGEQHTLLGRCWPGAVSDRTVPAAREWLRRWRPARGVPVVLACSCAAGRCPLCN